MDKFLGMLVVACSCVLGIHGAAMKIDKNFDWNAQAQEDLADTLQRVTNMNEAKNVILFLGDGMSLSTVAATRIFKGQQMGNPGEETVLAWEKFPYTGLSKTYNADKQTPDSAGTSIAYLCGEKSTYGTIGLNQHVVRTNCSSAEGNSLTSIMDWSKKEGKSVGIVTNARITHASPAGAYAHSADRAWESDADLPEECKDKVTDIAYQLIMDNYDIDVVLGGGRRAFIPTNETDPIESESYGKREDGLNLINIWEEKQKEEDTKYAFLKTRDDLMNLDTKTTDRVLGLFSYSHMEYEAYRPTKTPEQPTLSEMAEAARKLLSRNNKGYFLFVEAARMDHAHHAGQAHKALIEGVEFDKTTEQIISNVDLDDTLVVTTSDHSFAFTIGGYPSRGNDILGFMDTLNEPALDNKPHLTLAYHDGPGAEMDGARADLTDVDIHDLEFKQQSLVPMVDATHDASDVGIYAIGPMSHLFVGVHEQHYIAHAMAYASCVGRNQDHCKGKTPEPKCTNTSFNWQQNHKNMSIFIVTLCTAFIKYNVL